MNTPIKSAFKVSLITAALATATFAQAETTHRQHDAHVHGVVEFNIAQDGNEMLMEITAPGADIVGFEHAPENDKQHHAIADAEAILKDAAAIFTLSSSAKCVVEHVSVTNTLEKDHDDHSEHDHEEHAHDDDHSEHDHEEHAHHDDHSEHDHEEHAHHDDHSEHDHEEHAHHDDHSEHDHAEHESSHGAFTVEYHFECENIAAVSEIKTEWFTHFPSTEKVDVNLLTDTVQKAVELNSKNNLIKF